MQTRSKQTRNASAPPYAQYGIPLGRTSLRALEKRGIYCQTSISVEHQHLAKRYVLRGVESGGAVSDMGRYCAYLNLDGTPIPWLQPIDSLAGNGRHAIIVAPELVRIEMFRIGRTYELAITRHSLMTHDGRAKPAMESTLLFRGRDGSLAEELTIQRTRSLRAPTFFSEAGEVREIPALFDAASGVLTAALHIVPCKRAQIALPPRVSLFNSSHCEEVRA